MYKNLLTGLGITIMFSVRRIFISNFLVLSILVHVPRDHTTRFLVSSWSIYF